MNNGSPQSAHSAAKNGIQSVSSYSLIACICTLVCATLVYLFPRIFSFKVEVSPFIIGLETVILILFFIKILVITTKSSKLNVISQICVYSLSVLLIENLISGVINIMFAYNLGSLFPDSFMSITNYVFIILSFIIGIGFFLFSTFFKSHKLLFLITIVVGISYLLYGFRMVLYLVLVNTDFPNYELLNSIYGITWFIANISYVLFYFVFWQTYKNSINTQ